MHLPVISWFVAVVLSLVAARVQSQGTTGGDRVDTTTCSTRQLVEVGLLSSRQLGEVQTTIEMMSHQIESLQQQIQQQREERPRKTAPRDCADLLTSGNRDSGVYTVWLADTGKHVEVYCDMDTDGGGWLVFQRRQNGVVDFYRDWTSYKNGFGRLTGEFWIGKSYKLRFDLEDFNGSKRFAVYSSFAVGPECVGYKSRLGSYSGDAGDSFGYHGNAVFSTKDKDNEHSCAGRYKGAWWYKKCHFVNMNGLYRRAVYSTDADGVTWHTWLGNQYSLKKTEMKLRP
ncbi:Fibrinogen C domain-containing protein 1 [Lamellibrachia satsuma]|nr:Fibrinogen C domain-containing protein 1 [Lamellibrachia satsuma]